MFFFHSDINEDCYKAKMAVYHEKLKNAPADYVEVPAPISAVGVPMVQN